MQIVIEIDDEMYEKVIKTNVVYVLEDVDCILIENAIANGTPLPKGHGRLIDADRLVRVDHIILESEVNNAPTIIPAEEAGNDKN